MNLNNKIINSTNSDNITVFLSSKKRKNIQQQLVVIK